MRRLLTVLLFVVACSDSGTEPLEPGVAASIAFIGGAGQSAVVATELPQAVSVRVTDSAGRAVPGQLVTFAAVEVGGQVLVGTATTNDDGVVQERWTLGTTAGPQVLEARMVDPDTGEPIVAQLDATAEPGPAAEITSTPSEHTLRLDQVLDLGSFILVADEYGNVIADAPLELTADPPLYVDGATVYGTEEVAGEVTVTSGEATGTVPVKALRNIADFVGAEGRYRCTGRHLETSFSTMGDLMVLDERLEFTIDSIVPGPAGSVATFWVSGGQSLLIEEDPPGFLGDYYLAVGFSNRAWVVAEHEPGYILFAEAGGTGQDLRTQQISTSPLMYSGGHRCGGWELLETWEPFVITKDVAPGGAGLTRPRASGAR